MTPPLPSTIAEVPAAIDGWVRSPALAALVTAFAGETPDPWDDDLAGLLTWLEDFSLRWDFRGGKERNLVADQEFAPATVELIPRSADELGLVGTTPPAGDRYDHVLILGGLVRACLARPLHAAALLADRTISAGSITGLGGYRPLGGDELELAARIGHSHLTDEFDAMHAGMRAAFGLGEPTAERGEQSDEIGASWRVVGYEGPDGTPVQVVGAPSSEPGTRRANTPDTYAWFATDVAKLSGGERILVVTSDIYIRFQHADAMRMLALPYGVAIDAVGIQPGDVDERLRQRFAPHSYLQEIRSTIRAMRALHAAL
jgi:hypothetical protein